MKTGIMRKLHKESQGFTLIELMIVVAIIGILAAIAIPNFMRYQLKSKTTEAKENIGGINTALTAFKAENDWFVDCKASPAKVSKTGAKQAWTTPKAKDGWSEIGFAPASNVYYQYQVQAGGAKATAPVMGIAATNTGDDYAVGAVADLDANGKNGEFGYASDTGSTGKVTVPKANNKTSITQINTIQNLVPNEF